MTRQAFSRSAERWAIAALLFALAVLLMVPEHV